MIHTLAAHPSGCHEARFLMGPDNVDMELVAYPALNGGSTITVAWPANRIKARCFCNDMRGRPSISFNGGMSSLHAFSASSTIARMARIT